MRVHQLTVMAVATLAALTLTGCVEVASTKEPGALEVPRFECFGLDSCEPGQVCVMRHDAERDVASSACLGAEAVLAEGVGLTCGDDGGCLPGLICLDGACAWPDCRSHDACGGQEVCVQGRCVGSDALEALHEGTPCDPEGEQPRCFGSLHCDPESARCVASECEVAADCQHLAGRAIQAHGEPACVNGWCRVLIDCRSWCAERCQ